MFYRFTKAFAGLVISIVTSVLVMIYGWGLQPRSWTWIIGVYLVGNTIAILLVESSQRKKK